MSLRREVYAQKALAQIPRLLSLQDRNPFSSTYGCFHRDYWLYKTSDFPDAVRQFGVQALALVYKHDFPYNPYKGQTKIQEWTIAGLDFWSRIQHKDGSFDEFYPYERGWVGPSAFTTYTAIEAYRLLQDEMPPHVRERVLAAIKQAAQFIAAGESEEDHLANHHAMACLAVWKAYELTGSVELKRGFERLWKGFLRYHNKTEGWSREYDGVDPGYLSATISFLAKIYQTNPDPDIFEVLRQSVEFCSYFVYPNGFYAGSVGSRNTLHFYPHGFEILAEKIPLAAAVAEKMLVALAEGKLVPPEVMSDRYVFYRVPEFLQAYLNYTPRLTELPPLPYEQGSFTRYFHQARIFVANQPPHYIVANLAKGGVIKVFDRWSGQLVLNDCGIIGQLANGRVVTSQWIDPAYECQLDEGGWEVRGYLQEVPSHQLFTPFKHLIFRGVLIALGWSPSVAHRLKGVIRKTLILSSRSVSVRFRRRFDFKGDHIGVIDELELKKNHPFISLAIGDEFFVRHVPQSRYFQAQELEVQGWSAGREDLEKLNKTRSFCFKRVLGRKGSNVASKVISEPQGALQNSTEGSTQGQADEQREYWQSWKKRRHPAGPIIASFVLPKLDFVKRFVELPKEPKILDVGCGNGYFSYYLAQWGYTVGIDYSWTMLKQNPHLGIAQASAYQLPFKRGMFDLVICSNLLHHLDNPEKVLEEMKRVSRRYVVISEPNRNNPAMFLLGILKPEEKLSLRFTKDYVRRLAESVGLSVLICNTIGFVTPNRMPRLVATLLSKFNNPNPFAAYSVLVAQCDK